MKILPEVEGATYRKRYSGLWITQLVKSGSKLKPLPELCGTGKGNSESFKGVGGSLKRDSTPSGKKKRREEVGEKNKVPHDDRTQEVIVDMEMMGLIFQKFEGFCREKRGEGERRRETGELYALKESREEERDRSEKKKKRNLDLTKQRGGREPSQMKDASLEGVRGKKK